MLNKNFYITITVGLILVVVNLATMGLPGLALIVPINYLISIFGFFDENTSPMHVLTGCEG